MKKSAIIGLGTICKYYAKGILESDYMTLVAVCDELENPASLEYFKDKKFYRDYKKLIEEQSLDYVIISTPPDTHYEISKYALEQGVSVIIEKPALLSLSEYDEILELAKSKDLVFEVMFHWQNGEEVLEFNRSFDKKKIQAIKVKVYDPYSADGESILAQKVKLKGAFVDSGVNAISMIKEWLPLDDVTVTGKEIQLCPISRLPVYAKISANMDGVPVEIMVDWRKGENNKCSYLIYDGKEMVVSSSEQAIYYDGKKIDCAKILRLQAHYSNYFKRFKGVADTISARKIHETLFKLRDY